MSKAEEYIKAYTRGCSNELVGGGYHEWLTPENALAAVELAREEMKKDALEGYVSATIYLAKHCPEDIAEIQVRDSRIAAKVGEKVKVIIIKE